MEIAGAAPCGGLVRVAVSFIIGRGRSRGSKFGKTPKSGCVGTANEIEIWSF